MFSRPTPFSSLPIPTPPLLPHADYESETSAADFCNALNGILSEGSSAPAQLDHVKASLGVSGGAGGAAASVAAGSGSNILSSWLQNSWRGAFNKAYECIAKRKCVTDGKRREGRGQANVALSAFQIILTSSPPFHSSPPPYSQH